MLNNPSQCQCGPVSWARYWSWYWSVWPSMAQCAPVSRRWWMMSTLVVSNPPGMRPPVLDITDTHTDTWHDPHWTPQSSLSHNGVMKVPPIHLTQLEPDQELDLCDPSCHQTAPSDYTRPLDKNINWYNTHHHYTPQPGSIRHFLSLRCLTFLLTRHLIWCTMYVWDIRVFREI